MEAYRKMKVLFTSLWILEGLMFSPTTSGAAVNKDVDLSRDNENPISLALNASSERAYCLCGNPKENRILGGSEAVKGEIPWQVMLGQDFGGKNYFYCAGTFIGSFHVLTAAHCNQANLKGVKVYVGSNKLVASTFTIKDAGTFRSHPRYRPNPPANDIAIIKVPRGIHYNSNTFPICLPLNFRTTDWDGVSLKISGWGETSPQQGYISQNLKKGFVKGISNAKCSQLYGRSVDPSMLCAVSNPDSFCYGDHGGPLTYTKNRFTYLVGIMSFPNACIKSETPGLFTRVAPFIDWIIAEMGGKPVCTN